MDDETKKQFCYELFNHRFFEEFFDNMCYEHSDIWNEVVDSMLEDCDITEKEIENFYE